MTVVSRIVRVLGLLILLLVVRGGPASAQMPRAGQDFTFGVIEGPDKSSILSQLTTTLYLTVISPYDGCGILTSPSGYRLQFSFSANVQTRVTLDHSLMHLDDLGKTKKGLLLHTTEPVNVVLHDYAAQAGDATQILPDEALDTAYVVSGAGLFNDIANAENNRFEFLITAKEDNTQLTITPSVQTLLNQPRNVPFTVTLDRGECYMVKADSGSQPARTSLSGSTISATHPVSVITGITCGYIPSGFQSCNLVMDQLTGKKYWGTHFFVQPLGNDDLTNTSVIVITSDRDFFASINGAPNSSSGKRIQSQFTDAVEIVTTTPVEVEQFSRGSSFGRAGVSDPSMVTILPVEHYVDTMLWSTPASFGDGNTFANWVPLVFPTAQASAIKLDGSPIANFGIPFVINGSNMSGLLASVFTGVHTLTSPVPISALVTGFNSADAYTFIPGTIGQEISRDTIHRKLVMKGDPATTCTEFGVVTSLDSAFLASESVQSIQIVLTYDPKTLSALRVEQLQALLGSKFTVDSSTLGTLVITAIGQPLLTGKDLFRIVFSGLKATGSTNLTETIAINACSEHVEKISSGPIAFSVAAGSSNITRDVAMQATPAVTCQPVTVSVTTDQFVAPSDNLVPLKVEVIFDPTDQQFLSATNGALLTGIPTTQTGGASGDYAVTVTTPTSVSGSDQLLAVTLDPRTNKTVSVKAHATFLVCSDTITKDLTLNYPVLENIDSTHVTLSIAAPSVTYGNIAATDISISGVPASAHVRTFDLYVTYNHNLLTYLRSDLAGTLTNGYPAPTVTPIDSKTDKLTFVSPSGDLGVNGILAHLLFNTFVSDSASTPVSVSSSLSDASTCPLSYRSPEAQTIYMGKDLCGDSVLRAYLRHQTISIDRAQFSDHNTLDLRLFTGHTGKVKIDIINVLGETVFSGEVDCSIGSTDVSLNLPAGLSSDQYVVRAELDQFVSSRKFIKIR